MKTEIEPTLAYRTWSYVYERPRRMGWPNLTRTGWANRKAEQIAPRMITVQVHQSLGSAPQINSMQVSGFWAGTTLAVTKEKISHQDKPGRAFTIYAPEWVMELAADALRRAGRDLELAEHGAGCCCKNCPWDGNHG